MKFTELNLHPSVMRGIEEAGFVECTPVQEATLKKTLSGVDACVQSQTGTGKTAAFLITIFHLFLTDAKYRHRKALVLTPTRELAIQVDRDAQVLGMHCDLKSGCFYGGVGYAEQDRLLREDLNLFIGTPGRLIDYQKSGKIDFLKFEFLVIDEADRMFDMGFIPDIRYMVKRMVPPTKRVTMLFSATLSDRVKHLAWEYMNDPVEIEINPEQLTVDLITQRLYHVGKSEKFGLLLGILRKEKPKSVLIFTNMKVTAERVSRRLAANGIKNDYISGDLPQNQRMKIIDAIKAGKTEILVATDVAARGLHIEDLDMVINYDLPEESQNYVHRIGRTARAGKTGSAVSLACEEDVFNLAPIERLIDMRIPVEWPDEGLIVTDAVDVARYPRRDGERPARGERGRGREKPERRGREKRAASEKPARPARGRDHAKPERREPHEQPEGTEHMKNRQNERRPADAGARDRASTGERRQERARPAASGAERDAEGKRKRRRRRGKKPADAAAAASAPPRQGRAPSRGPQHGMPRIKSDATPEERIEYYRKKYGDHFEKTSKISGGPARTRPKTLVESIKGLFKKKK